MKIPFLDLTRQQFSLMPRLQESMKQVVLNDWLLGGKAVTAFEKSWAEYLQLAHVVSTANCTDALEVILRAIEIVEGDEVIVPANGWLSAAEVVRLLGATPVFVDCDPVFYHINPKLIAEKITSHTKAIIPIHLYGQPADMPAIMEIARQHQLFVIEDCAQAHGAEIRGKKAGNWGHAAAFSFYPTKNLGALGDAGAICTQDAALAEKCRQIASHGQQAKNCHVRLGRNSRMDSIQAAVLLEKLPYLDKWNQRRKQLAQLYHDLLKDLPLQLPRERKNALHVYHLFVISLEKRDDLKAFLEVHGVETAIHYPQAVAEMDFLAQGESTSAFQAIQQSRRLLSLPLYPELTEEEVHYVAQMIRLFFEG
ncbi:MAG: DegT/DnrJ/EryC1/StrS family aminotransferase [Cyclobacteriaceae bacterium]